MKRKNRRFAPSVSQLEGRQLLSTFTVTNNNDSGSGSLRDAVALSNLDPGSTINFATSVTGDILLTSGEIDITAKVMIRGPESQGISIDAGGQSRIFEVSGVHWPEGAVEILDLVFENGNASSSDFTPQAGGDGGAVQGYDNAYIRFFRCSFTDNFATNRGGAIYNQGGLLSVNDCLFSNNSTSYHGGAIYNSGVMTVSASEFLGNYAGEGGGAIENAQSIAELFGSSPIEAHVYSSKFFNNEAFQYGGAVSNDNGGLLVIGGGAGQFRSEFISNIAGTNGGAVSSGSVGPLGTVSMTFHIDDLLIFKSNTAGRFGGAIYSMGAADIHYSDIQFNVAVSPAPSGGGIYAKGSLFTGSDNLIQNNTPDNIVLV